MSVLICAYVVKFLISANVATRQMLFTYQQRKSKIINNIPMHNDPLRLCYVSLLNFYGNIDTRINSVKPSLVPSMVGTLDVVTKNT